MTGLVYRMMEFDADRTESTYQKTRKAVHVAYRLGQINKNLFKILLRDLRDMKASPEFNPNE